MPQLLGAADSFNSSSATVRAGGDDNNRRFARAAPSTTTGAQLGPAASIGRELDAIIGGRAGVLQSETAVGDENLLNRYLREFANANGNASFTGTASTSTTMSTSAPLARQVSEFNPLQFLNDPDTSGGTFFSDLALGAGALGPASVNPATFAYQKSGAQDNTALYRPSSAMSNHSRLSLSSTDVDTDGFYTTDMDTDVDGDAGDADHVSPNPLAGIRGLNLGPSGTATISPSADALGSARPHHARGSGAATSAAAQLPQSPLNAIGSSSSRALGQKRSVRGVTSREEEEARRIERIEHRRSINRKSAQKHRLRRKEELVDLSQQVAERDERIRFLERELAVAHARINQMATFLQSFKKDGSK
ncbi:uncharacterized protein EHS24_007412 [Apiotrichum porosum]|uniref:BZIP domain-containing protein n=1 Tax=Apiotrichum porosum TaxID=105984 RepID=A0A427XUD5_9TREE|nr:uncharacterized protein EHS24_007412 [Apiotrichum porosum]RSH82442.1 hypothetical protein EHS24_007412 [Apiotrichum porosum]